MRIAFSQVVLAHSSSLIPSASERAVQVYERFPEWLSVPRSGCGARYGQSVSMSTDFGERTAAASFVFLAFLKLIVPENEIRQPMRSSSRAISALPE